jgi:hypothetical protein
VVSPTADCGRLNAAQHEPGLIKSWPTNKIWPNCATEAIELSFGKHYWRLIASLLAFPEKSPVI